MLLKRRKMGEVQRLKIRVCDIFCFLLWRNSLVRDNKKMELDKEIFIDFNSIILWHKSEDINKESLFPKFQLIPILRFQVTHDYVCFIAPIDYCVELHLVDKTFCETCSHFILKGFQCNFFGEMCFLEESYEKMQKNSNFDNFESVLYSKSGSMPLNPMYYFSLIFLYIVGAGGWY